MFDNLYFVGSKIHSSWALTTSEGIILIDTLFTYNSEEEIVGGLKKLGLDPATVKYVIISHAHGDHVGGAKLMQDRFGSHIVMGGPDWDSIEKSVNGYPQGKPKRDIVADDGQKITLGDTTVTIVTTPGHTPGTLSMLFTVKDNGKPLNVAYSGGTAFNFPSTVPNFDIYIKSQAQDGRGCGGGERHHPDVEPLGIRQRRFEDQDARRAQAGRAASLRPRQRGGGALFHGHRGMRASGAAQADAATEVVAGRWNPVICQPTVVGTLAAAASVWAGRN